MSDYTPTTRRVRQGYVTFRENPGVVYPEEAEAEFDRWLRFVEASVVRDLATQTRQMPADADKLARWLQSAANAIQDVEP